MSTKYFVEVIQYATNEPIRSVLCNDQLEANMTQIQLSDQVDRRFYDVRIREAA